MDSSNDYHQYLVKPTPSKISREIISSGLSNYQSNKNILYKPNIFEDLKLSFLNKNSESKNLGPGRYNTPTPPSGPSYNFGYAQRFKHKEYPCISLTKSTDKIKQNKKVEKYSPLSKTKSQWEKFKNKHTAEILNKYTKNILETEKKQRILGKIQEKYDRIESRKNIGLKNSISQTFTTLLVFSMIPFQLFSRFHQKNKQKAKIFKNLKLLMMFSKAIGKFVILKKNVKIKSAWKIFRKYLPKMIKKRQNHIKEIFIKRVYFVVYNFLNSFSIPKLNFFIKKSVQIIQTNAKNFIQTSWLRRYCIRKLWGKYDKSKEKIPENVKNYYIHNYINKSIQEFLKLKKNFLQNFVFVIDAFEGLKQNDFSPLKIHKKPVLQLYSKSCIKELISFAYKTKNDWNLNANLITNNENSPTFTDRSSILKDCKGRPRKNTQNKKITFVSKEEIMKFKPFTRRKSNRIKLLK